MSSELPPGLGSEASTVIAGPSGPAPSRSTSGVAAGELDGRGDDLVAVVVLGGDVVAALQPAVVDVAAVRAGEVLALARVDDVVLARREQQQRHRQLAVAAGQRREAVVEQRDQRRQRRAVVGDLDDAGLGDVAADARGDVGAGGEQLADHRADVGRLRLGERVDEHEAADVRVVQGRSTAPASRPSTGRRRRSARCATASRS